MLQRGDCYQKNDTWCIICEVGTIHTLWRTAYDPSPKNTPTLALELHLEVEGWEKLPFKVSPDFKMSTHCVMTID